MINILGYLAKHIYKEKYKLLRECLLTEFEFIKINQSENSNMLSKLLISGEDHRFYYHLGFDVIAMMRAIRNRLFYKKIEGASTIEQQLVRVLTNDFERKLSRKIQEIFLATTIKSIIPKNTIPIIYLNVAYYGVDMKGLNQVFTKLDIKKKDILPLEQAAEIVSRIKYPQTKHLNQNRLKQIEVRKQHLISLYNKHSNQIYFKIYDRY